MNVIEKKGRFRLVAENPGDPTDWGTLRVACDPDGAGARQLMVLDAIIEPGKGHAFHLHPEQEEVLYVVSGKVEQWLDRETRILGAGDSVFIPQGVVHASYCAGDEPARVLAVFGPCVGEGMTMVDKAGEAPWSGLRG